MELGGHCIVFVAIFSLKLKKIIPKIHDKIWGNKLILFCRHCLLSSTILVHRAFKSLKEATRFVKSSTCQYVNSLSVA